MGIRVIMTVAAIVLASSQLCLGSTPEMLSHAIIDDSEEAVAVRVASITQRLRSADPASLALPLDETLEILGEMASCKGLGRWLLMHQGLNGFWTAEAILRAGGEGASDISKWIASDAPIFRATCERFKIFQEELQKRLDAEDITFVSVPCGTMEDLLRLDPKDKEAVTFIGVDLDPQAFEWVKKAAAENPGTSFFQKVFCQADAFELPTQAENADVAVSNGLNFYINDDAEVVRLYKVFAASLKVGGTLITSHLSPPALAKPYDMAALKKQLAIVRDICEMRWQIFRPEELVRAQLTEAGFEVQQVIWDTQNMFPTYVCQRVR